MVRDVLSGKERPRTRILLTAPLLVSCLVSLIGFIAIFGAIVFGPQLLRTETHNGITTVKYFQPGLDGDPGYYYSIEERPVGMGLKWIKTSPRQSKEFADGQRK